MVMAVMTRADAPSLLKNSAKKGACGRVGALCVLEYGFCLGVHAPDSEHGGLQRAIGDAGLRRPAEASMPTRTAGSANRKTVIAAG